MGNSSLDHVTCDKQLFLYYNEINVTLKVHIIYLNHYNIEQNFTGVHAAALSVTLNQFSYTLTVQIP